MTNHLVRSSILFAAMLALLAAASAQTPQPAPQSPLGFDVATIKPYKDGDGHVHLYTYTEDGRFAASNVSLVRLIQFAYNMPDHQILDAAPWMHSIPYNIEARTDPPVDAYFHSLPSTQARLEKYRLVRALLADRFQLRLHPETRTLPAYALVLAKGGSRLKPSDNNGVSINTYNNHFADRGVSPVDLAQQLSTQTGRVVLDQTGLTGKFDVTLLWTPDDAPATSADNAPPPLFTALEEQLGLKLEPIKAPVPVLVVDHAEPPSPN